MIFVFGSNESGIHGGGAAKIAEVRYGAKRGLGFGFSGDSFAIPTKNWFIRGSLAADDVRFYVRRFLEFARVAVDMEFQVTQIGCGLAGFTAREIAPMFADAPNNCLFDTAWKPILGDSKRYWGTF